MCEVDRKIKAFFGIVLLLLAAIMLMVGTISSAIIMEPFILKTFEKHVDL